MGPKSNDECLYKRHKKERRKKKPATQRTPCEGKAEVRVVQATAKECPEEFSLEAFRGSGTLWTL